MTPTGTIQAPSSDSPAVDMALIRDPAAARSLLNPLRRTILERLGEPGSASRVAEELDLPRQRVNYHVRELETEGLLRHVEDRRRGNCVERVVQASARSFLIDPVVLRAGGVATGPVEEEPGEQGREEKAPAPDPFSNRSLLESAARTLAAVGDLHALAEVGGRRVPTLSLDFRIRFRSPREELEFAQVMERLIQRMVTRYHAPRASSGRDFRITLGGHLVPEVAEEGGKSEGTGKRAGGSEPVEEVGA
jgi:DNA-binding transcriptional ArsR family regulator